MESEEIYTKLKVKEVHDSGFFYAPYIPTSRWSRVKRMFKKLLEFLFRHIGPTNRETPKESDKISYLTWRE